MEVALPRNIYSSEKSSFLLLKRKLVLMDFFNLKSNF